MLDFLQILSYGCLVLYSFVRFLINLKQSPSLGLEIHKGVCTLSGSLCWWRLVTPRRISCSDRFRAYSDKCHPKWFWEEELKTLILVHMLPGLQQNHLSFFPFDFLPLKMTIKLKNFQENFSWNSQACEMFQVWINLFRGKCFVSRTFRAPRTVGLRAPQCQDLYIHAAEG